MRLHGVRAASAPGPIEREGVETHDNRPFLSRIDRDADRGAMDSVYRLPGDDERPSVGGKLRRPAPRPVPLWGQRAHRAYLNAIECFAPFAALVIVAQVAGKANGMTAFWAMSYFWLRLAHAIVYWTAIPYLRTVLFTLGFVCVVGTILGGDQVAREKGPEVARSLIQHVTDHAVGELRFEPGRFRRHDRACIGNRHKVAHLSRIEARRRRRTRPKRRAAPIRRGPVRRRRSRCACRVADRRRQKSVRGCFWRAA